MSNPTEETRSRVETLEAALHRIVGLKVRYSPQRKTRTSVYERGYFAATSIAAEIALDALEAQQ